MKDPREIYFQRYAWQGKEGLEIDPSEDLEIVIIIPSYREPHTQKAVSALLNCHPVPCRTAILVVVNQSESDPEEITAINQDTLQRLSELPTHDRIALYAIDVHMPGSKAGVGLARKIGMDLACRWFHKLNRDGILVCFDADCACDYNYLQCIYERFTGDSPDIATLFYEHPLDPDSGIISYESHLRYYVDALRYAGYPFAIQTLGSCIVVKAFHYIRSGGMNTRKAGEDFYFLHQSVPLGRYSEINETTVRPSARLSDRVPFGTGKALSGYRSGEPITTYNWEIFMELKAFLKLLPDIENNEQIRYSDAVDSFLQVSTFDRKLQHIRKQSVSPHDFRRNFYQWFDGFRVLKFVHHHRDNGFPDTVVHETLNLANEHYWSISNFATSPERRLQQIRDHDRKNPWTIRI